MISISLEAGVIQLVECQLPKLDVAGSIPVPRSMFPTSYSERSNSQSPLSADGPLQSIHSFLATLE